MNRAGERVKGATSARQLSGPCLGQRRGVGPELGGLGLTPPPSRKKVGALSRETFFGGAGRKGWGVVESLELPSPANRRPPHRRIFFVICGISDRRGRGAATPSHVRQADAARCNAPLPDRGELIAPAQPHRQAWRIEVRTEGTVRTDRQAGQISADLAAGACSHWPAREVGTVGTEESGGREGQNPRALVASPARPPAGAVAL